MQDITAGYQEHEHTADWELEVWAPDLPGLFVQSARGMWALSGARLATEPRQERTLELEAQDEESLLVNFLGELLYLAELENLCFDTFELKIAGKKLQGSMLGARLLGRDKEIKAVTYHNLSIRKTGRGLEARVVFDV
ncbi:MAG TPA: archease [Anaerolineales bacterium]|nr:archease [Anaerolineales bacterium]